jgi:hypothetical protein
MNSYSLDTTVTVLTQLASGKHHATYFCRKKCCKQTFATRRGALQTMVILRFGEAQLFLQVLSQYFQQKNYLDTLICIA